MFVIIAPYRVTHTHYCWCLQLRYHHAQSALKARVQAVGESPQSQELSTPATDDVTDDVVDDVADKGTSPLDVTDDAQASTIPLTLLTLYLLACEGRNAVVYHVLYHACVLQVHVMHTYMY
jgi:hypothetical protein